MKRLLILMTMFVTLATASASVIPDMRFRRLDTREGLSSSTVFSILRDSRGYVWMGTGYGLNRYDGYRIRTFFSYDKDTTSLRNNRVDEIQEGHGGRLWLKQGMNYSVYDPVTEKVDRNPSNWLNQQGIVGSIESLHLDSEKNYWVKTYEDGFYFYDPVSKNLKHLKFGYGDNEFPKEFGISAYTESKEGMILVSTYGELICLDGPKGRIIWKNDYVKRALDAYNDYWVTVDKDDNIWVITHSVGTYIYVKKENRWYTSITELMRARGFENVPEDVIVWEICYDAKGLLWVATDHLGVFVIDFDNKEWRAFTNVKGDDTSLPDITVKHLYLDQLGRMWLATYKNGVAMCSEALSNFKSLAVGDINAITEDREGNYWLGRNDGGIIKMDSKTLEPLETFTKQSLGVPSDIIVGSYTSKDGSLWFGTYEGGLLQYKNGTWKNYRNTDPGSAFMTNNIWGITEDRWGHIWVGVLGGGAVRIDKNTGKQRVFNADNTVLNTVWTNSINTASNGWILLGNSEYYALIHPGNFKVINGTFPQDNSMKAITVSSATTQALWDSRGLLWQCSPSGLVIYDRKTGQKTLLDMKSGLQGSNAVSVAEDISNSIWVATDHGVSNVTPQKQDDGLWTFVVRNFNDRDGLQPGPFNQRAIFCSRSGDLLIGGQDGLDIISTTKLGNGDSKEKPVFSGLVLFDQEVEVGEKYDGRVILKEALDMQRSISLSYNENQFTIHMASDNGGVNNSTRFIYQLKGFNDKWLKTTAVNPDITYMSLPPGSYTLCVHMMKDDGTMGEEESRLEINIASPWYSSWWAWTLYALLVAVIAFFRRHISRLLDMKKILSLLLLTGTLYVSAQTSLIPDMKFRRLDTQNGLSTSQINNIFKDSRGYVWIGTPYGLNRYDGYRVKTFYSNKRDTTTMRDNYVDRVFEASDGRLWMRQGMNYCVYDPVTESFERNASHELAKMGVNTSVEWLHIDSKKRIWVKSFEEGIYCIYPGKKGDRKIVKIKSGYGMNEFHPDYGISTVAELGDRLVVATNMGELVCLNGEKGEVEWVDSHMRQNGGPENQEYRLFIDHHDNYWCEALNYTFIYIKKENKWYSTVESYFADHGIFDVPGPLMVWNLVVDKNDWLWLACDHDGLIVVDLKSKQWKQFLNNKFDETTISDNTLRTLMIPDDGSVWIGTYKNGVNQYVPGLSSLSTVELGDITTASEDKNGNYWLGTNDAGILVYNPKKGEVINHFTKDNSGLVSNIVVGSWPSRDGTIWFGSYNGGLTHCIPSATDPSQATVVNIQATENGQGLANNSVWALTEDKWGRMWFSTLGGGLQMLDPKTRKFTTWSTKNTQIPGDYLTSVSWNKKGWLMVGTSNHYSLVNPVTGKLANQIIPDDPSIKSNITSTNYVIEDSRGLIWHGSSSGLLVHDPKTKFIKLLDMTSGLYGSGINSIIEDKKHNIWTVTDHGVSNIVPIRQDDGTWQFNIRSYNSRDGLQKAVYNQRSIFLTHDGKVLVGGQGGLDIIDPSKLEDTKSQEHPVFSGLQIFDQNIAVGEKYDGRVILDEALDVCRELSLKFNDQFTIQLATNEVSVGNSKRFAYKLEGFNENWVRTSELNPNVMFNSLRAGSYTLCVRILKEDGSLGEIESRLDITIRPPLWRTRWMILFYMLAIAGVAFWWRRWFLRKQTEKMELEQLRRETEKKQWMSEMRRKMDEEMKQFVSRESKVYVADENGVVDTQEETVYKERIDLVPLFRAVCDEFKAPGDKMITLSFFPFVDYLDIMGDRQQMVEMLQILLKNAATFSPSKSKIKVFLEKNDKNAVIRIADNGIGIPSEAMPHLFEEIVGDDDSPNLHKVFDIVMNHNGTIRAEENNGGGSVFVIELPDEIEIPVEDAVMMDDDETSDNSK